MHIAVCDDQALFLKEIEGMLQALPEVGQVTCFEDRAALAEAIRSGAAYDALLLDIDWEGEAGGMELAGQLQTLAPTLPIIYVTGYGERFAQQIFLHPANLSGYLTKPVDPGLLQANLRKAAAGKGKGEGAMLCLQVGGSTVTLDCAAIDYIESHGHRIQVHAGGEVITAYEKLSDVFARLPGGFAQCHKSFVVRFGAIRRFRAKDILLQEGTVIPVSRARYAETRLAYFDYMGRSF